MRAEARAGPGRRRGREPDAAPRQRRARPTRATSTVVPGMALGARRAAAAQEAADRRAEPPQPSQGSVHRGRRGAAAPVRRRTWPSRIVNARLFERSRNDADAFETLAEIGRDVASVLDLDELFARIAQLDAARSSTTGRSASCCSNEERGELEMKLRRAVRRQGARPARAGSAKGSSATRRCTRSRCSSPTSRRIRATSTSSPTCDRSWSIPMLLKDRCIGVLDLESPELDAFTQARRRDPDAARQPGRRGDRERAALRRPCAPTRSGSRRKCASRSACRRRCCRRGCRSG